MRANLLWLTLLLTAAATPLQGPISVGEGAVVGAWPIHLTAAWTWDWTAAPIQVHDGALLVVRTEPSLARPTNQRGPILMVDDHALGVLRVSPDARCVVGLLPVDPGAAARVFWSPGDRLPEQIDAEDAARRLDAAKQISPVALPRGSAFAAADHLAFDAILDGMLAGCSASFSP